MSPGLESTPPITPSVGATSSRAPSVFRPVANDYTNRHTPFAMVSWRPHRVLLNRSHDRPEHVPELCYEPVRSATSALIVLPLSGGAWCHNTALPIVPAALAQDPLT